jgi:hypothetical protein
MHGTGSHHTTCATPNSMILAALKPTNALYAEYSLESEVFGVEV